MEGTESLSAPHIFQANEGFLMELRHVIGDEVARFLESSKFQAFDISQFRRVRWQWIHVEVRIYRKNACDIYAINLAKMPPPPRQSLSRLPIQVN
jgi:hypothetical protein